MKKKSGSPDGARRILDAFELEMKDLPADMPYRVGNSLKLPEQLTSLEIRQIGAMSRLGPYKGGFYLGDMSLWLQSHPDPSILQEEFTKMVIRSGLARRTFPYNYKSVSNSFPLKERHRELSRQHHDAVRTLPRSERRRLLEQAAKERWSDVELREHTRRCIAEREDPPPAGPIAARTARNSLLDNRTSEIRSMQYIDIPRKSESASQRRGFMVRVDERAYGRLKALKEETGWSMSKIIEFAVQKIRVRKT
jgi:hypothetical protein